MKRKSTRSATKPKTIRRILRLLGAHRLLLALSLLFAAVNALLSLVIDGTLENDKQTLIEYIEKRKTTD